LGLVLSERAGRARVAVILASVDVKRVWFTALAHGLPSVFLELANWAVVA
jgi:hypothetical protein